MKKLICFIFFTGQLVLSLSGITLNEAIEKAKMLNTDLKNHTLESRVLKVDHQLKSVERYFKLALSGHYLYRSETVNIKLDDFELAPGTTVPGPEISGGVNHNVDLKLTISQPLFTGNALSGMIRISERNQSLHRRSRRLLELMLAGRVKTVYFNCRMLESQMQSLNTLGEKIDNHLKKLEDLYNEGLVRKSNILETRIKKKEISLSAIEVENSLNSLKTAFTELTGSAVTDIENNHTETLPGEDKSMDIFLNNNPRLKMISDRVNLIEIQKSIIRGRDLPQVGLFGEFHYGVPGINFLSDKWDTYYQAGIEVKLNLFNWGRSAKKNRINDYNILKLKNREEEIIRKTELLLSDLFFRVRNLTERMNTYSEMITLAEEESELKRVMFEENLISNIEYVDTLLNVENLKSLKRKAAFQLELLKVEINSAIGRKEEK